MLSGVVLTAMGGGLYGFYQWTQTQYYVGKLKYLSLYQQSQIEDTIAYQSRSQAQAAAINQLSVQASACKKNAQNQAGGSKVTLTEDEQKVVSLCSSKTP
ncbi:hypothetical protein ACIHIX_15575 [Streptomyces sp. NPDC051913]|uniref:hypothetical protein n=1 Tax=Streptomyces sp. NPDC051913 TaxID=3365676 RepID=UPI0037D10990